MTIAECTRNGSEKEKPSTQAAVLLWAHELLRQHQAGWPLNVGEILALTASSKSQGYAKLAQIKQAVASGLRPMGRPRVQVSESLQLEVLKQVREFLISHPGVVHQHGTRRRYHQPFRAFVVDLMAPNGPAASLTNEQLSDLTGVPYGTLKEWRQGHQMTPHPLSIEPSDTAIMSTSATSSGQGTEAPCGSSISSAASSGQGAEAQSSSCASSAASSGQGAEAQSSSCASSASSAASSGQGAEAQSSSCASSAAPSGQGAEAPCGSSAQVPSPEIATILTEWTNWRGDLTSFCVHIKKHCRLNYGITFIRNLLEAVGLRQPRRRGRTTAAPPWSKGTYKTCFPGAQWLGDGKNVELILNGQTFSFNWEAMMDVASDGIVGITVTDEEDENAVIEAFKGGQATTGQTPLGVSLDRRPSNHSPAVTSALSPATVIPTTPGRGQAKAPIEGMFGLFEQTAPALNVAGKTPRELARSIVTLMLTLWALARNGKPRRRLGGLCPAEAYHAKKATPQEVQAAKDWLLELQRRAERAKQTRFQRTDPVKRQLVKQALCELHIDDPEERLSRSLCTFSTSAILRGIATFRTKREKGTIPPDADNGRYLGGIIRNLHYREELEQTASHLLEQRLRHQELSLAPLQLEAQRLTSTFSPLMRVEQFVDRALSAEPLVDFRFWGYAAANVLTHVTATQAAELYPVLSRKIAASFSVKKERREDLIAWLAEAASVPLVKESAHRVTKT